MIGQTYGKRFTSRDGSLLSVEKIKAAPIGNFTIYGGNIVNDEASQTIKECQVSSIEVNGKVIPLPKFPYIYGNTLITKNNEAVFPQKGATLVNVKSTDPTLPELGAIWLSNSVLCKWYNTFPDNDKVLSDKLDSYIPVIRDYIDIANKKIIKYTNQITINTSDIVTAVMGGIRTNTCYFEFTTNEIEANSPIISPGTDVMCNILKCEYAYAQDVVGIFTAGNRICIGLPKADIEELNKTTGNYVESLKKWLQTNPVTLRYVLKNPIEIDLTDDQLLTYMNNAQNITLNKLNNVEDTLNYRNGKLIYTKKIGKAIFSGYECAGMSNGGAANNWNFDSPLKNTKRLRFGLNYNIKYFKNNEDALNFNNFLCNKYRYEKSNNCVISMRRDDSKYHEIDDRHLALAQDTTINANTIMIWELNSIIAEGAKTSTEIVNNFRQYLMDQYNTGNPVTFLYEMEKPEVYEIPFTSEDLVTIKGANTFSVNCDSEIKISTFGVEMQTNEKRLLDNSVLKTQESENIKNGELIFDTRRDDIGIVLDKDSINDHKIVITGNEENTKNIIETMNNLEYTNKIKSIYPSVLGQYFMTTNNKIIGVGYDDNDANINFNAFNTSNMQPDNIELKSVIDSYFSIVAIKLNGSLAYSGYIASCIENEKIHQYKNIKKVLVLDSAGAYGSHILILLDDGRVVDSQNKLNDMLSTYNNIKDIAILYYYNNSNDEFNYIVLLDNNNKLLFIKISDSINFYDKKIKQHESLFNNVEKIFSNVFGCILLFKNTNSELKMIAADTTAGYYANSDILDRINEDYNNIKQIAISTAHMVAVKYDGTAIAGGYTLDGRCNVENWKNIECVSAHGRHTMALLKSSIKSTYDMAKEQLGENIKYLVPGEADITTKVYGLQVDLNNADPFAACTYTDDAYGMLPMAIEGRDNEILHRGSWSDKMVQDLMGCRPCILKTTPSNKTKVVIVTDDNLTDQGFISSLKALHLEDIKIKKMVYTNNGIVVLSEDNKCYATWHNDILATWNNIIDICVTDYDIVGLKSDGTCVYTNRNPQFVNSSILSWRNVSAIYGGDYGVVAVINGGTGYVSTYTSTTPSLNIGSKRITSMATGCLMALNGTIYTDVIIAVMQDGTCITNHPSDIDISSWTNIKEINLSDSNIIGLTNDYKLHVYNPNILYNNIDISKLPPIKNIEGEDSCVFALDVYGKLHTIVNYDRDHTGHELNSNQIAAIEKITNIQSYASGWNWYFVAIVEEDPIVENMGYLDPDNYYYWLDGSTCDYFKDTEIGERLLMSFMIEFDKIYTKFEYNETTKQFYMKFSKTRQDDTWKIHPAFLKSTESGVTEVDHIYISAYYMEILDYNDSEVVKGMHGAVSNPYNFNAVKSVRTLQDINKYILSNGYRDATNPYNRFQLLSYEDYQLLMDYLRLMFKCHNLYSIKLLNKPYIYNKLNVSHAVSSLHTGSETFNKGLFWRGYATKGTSLVSGDINGTGQQVGATKMFGIDNFFGCWCIPLRGLNVVYDSTDAGQILYYTNPYNGYYSEPINVYKFAKQYLSVGLISSDINKILNGSTVFYDFFNSDIYTNSLGVYIGINARTENKCIVHFGGWNSMDQRNDNACLHTLSYNMDANVSYITDGTIPNKDLAWSCYYTYK